VLNEREKSKNGLLALAPERRRRVESAPSPMKKDPDRNSTDSAEIEALINRLEREQLHDEEGGHGRIIGHASAIRAGCRLRSMKEAGFSPVTLEEGPAAASRCFA
jgi:hypothetical protein